MYLLLLFCSLITVCTNVEATLKQEATPVYISNDQGKSWANFADGLPDDVSTRNLLEHDGQLYLSTHTYGVFVLPAGAKSWEHRSAGLPIAEEGFFPTALAVQGKLVVLGTFLHGIYISKNGGANWRRSRFNLHGSIRCLLFDGERLLAGTDTGIWASNDHGESWERIGDDRTSVNALAIHQGQLFVAQQNGMGVMRGDNIVWSDLKTDWAILQLLTQGEYIYSVTVKSEIFRSKDGVVWEAPSPEAECLAASNLPEAIWAGFLPHLPTERSAGLVTETSRGWVVGVGTGCN